MMRVSTVLVAGLLASATQPAAAQAGRHPLVGQWNVEYTEGQQLASSHRHALRTRAVLTIAQRGKGLEATLEFPDSRADLTPPAQRLRGVVVGDSVLFAYSQPARVAGEHGTAIRATNVRWQIGASGNALSGTLVRVVPKSSQMLEPTVVTGKRAGG